MSAKKTKSGAMVKTSSPAGGMAPVEDHRFSDGPWPFAATIPATQAEEWMLHINAEMHSRNWSAAGMGQLDAEANSGSQTISLGVQHVGGTIELTWDKERGGRLEVRARPGGSPATPLEIVRDFFRIVDVRMRSRQRDRAHRRWWFVYEGIPWKGELWLGDSLRLGPPSRFPESLIGRQAVLVDAVVEGIGWQGVQAEFQRVLRDLRLVLSPILGTHLEESRNWESDWVPEFDEQMRLTDCRLRSVGYTELVQSQGMPARGSAPAADRETVTRPGLERFGIWADDRSVRIPHDIESLWAAFNALAITERQQFLNACNAYDIARSMWPSQRTAYVAFLVVACEALKPTNKRYEKANVYDVIANLASKADANALKSLRLAPQKVRSQHLHRGELAADELAPLVFGDPFRDPSFDDMLMRLSEVARICLIEWLRRGGPLPFALLPRPKTGKLKPKNRGRANS